MTPPPRPVRTHGEVVPVVWQTILPQASGQLETKLIPQTHRVQLCVDIQDQVHLEALTLTKQTRHCIKMEKCEHCDTTTLCTRHKVNTMWYVCVS